MQVETNETYKTLAPDGRPLVVRKRTREFLDEKTGERVTEVIDKVLQVNSSGKEVLKTRTRREQKGDGVVVVNQEKYEVDETGQHILVDHSRTVEGSGSAATQNWEEDFEGEEAEEEMTVQDDAGNPMQVRVQVTKKKFADGKVRNTGI